MEFHSYCWVSPNLLLPNAIIVPSKFGTKFACGDFNETGNRMIVTKGLGTSILTVRFLTVPEIVVIN